MGLSEGERVLAAQKLETTLANAAGRLNAMDRLMLKLRFVEGLTLRDTARILGLDERALYSRVKRVLGQLRKSLEGEGFGRSEAQLVWLEKIVVDVETTLETPSSVRLEATPGDARAIKVTRLENKALHG